jgi:hypothetical protein
VGSGRVGRSHHSRIQKGRGGAEIIPTLRKEFFPAAVNRRLTPPLDRVAPPVAAVLLADGVVLPPLGSARRQKAGRCVVSALLYRHFPAIRRQLQHPQLAADPSVPSSPKNISHIHAPPPN